MKRREFLAACSALPMFGLDLGVDEGTVYVIQFHAEPNRPIEVTCRGGELLATFGGLLMKRTSAGHGWAVFEGGSGEWRAKAKLRFNELSGSLDIDWVRIGSSVAVLASFSGSGDDDWIS